MPEQEILIKETKKANDEIINEYFDAMQTGD
jgi:hypothetical protein